MNKNIKTDSNFKKAVNELLGYQTDEELELDTQESSIPQFFDVSGQESQTGSAKAADMGIRPEEPGPQAPMPEVSQRQDTPSSFVADSMIAPDMEIMGNISSNTNITVSGRVIGNIACGGSVVIGGDVDGDITAAEIEIWGSVSGNITVAGKVTICGGAHVKGDITAHEVYTSGLSEGDIKVEGRAYFQSTSVILGNVYAKTFEMSGGAKIKGLVKTYD